MSTNEEFLTSEELAQLTEARRKHDCLFDEVQALEDELSNTTSDLQKQKNLIWRLGEIARGRKERHLAELEAGLADLCGKVAP